MKNDKRARPAENDARNDEDQRGRESQPDRNSEGTPIYLTGNSTLQSPEEHAHDASVDPRKDNRIDVNKDDLHEVRLGRMTGRDADTSGQEQE